MTPEEWSEFNKSIQEGCKKALRELQRLEAQQREAAMRQPIRYVEYGHVQQPRMPFRDPFAHLSRDLASRNAPQKPTDAPGLTTRDILDSMTETAFPWHYPGTPDADGTPRALCGVVGPAMMAQEVRAGEYVCRRCMRARGLL